MKVNSKSIVTCIAVVLSTHLTAGGSGFRGSRGPRGPRGAKGQTGAIGEVGPTTRFDPCYATAYISYDASEEEREIRSNIGTQIVPFTHMGKHSDTITFDTLTHKFSLPSGVYKTSFQFMLHSPEVINPRLSPFYIVLSPSSGPNILNTIDIVYSNSFLDRYTWEYRGEGILEVPDDVSYEAALYFRKRNHFSSHFRDPDVTDTTPGLEYNNYARITMVKMAEYLAPQP